MGFLDRLFGRAETPTWTPGPTDDVRAREDGPSEDERAVERYRYLLRTASPETIEEAHAEAFAQLTPEQRRMVLDELSRELPEHERADADDPRSLARLATRAEMRQPGTLERSFGGMGARGLGGGIGGSFFGAFAGILIGSAIAQQFFYDDAGAGDSAGGDDSQSDGDAEAGDVGDSGDAGGDFGGGDFGGGDFGGGDFGGGF